MKKIYQLVVLLVSLLYIYSSEDNCYEEDVSKKSKCHDKTVKDSGYYCCYIKSKDNDGTYAGCIELSKEEKNDIKKYIEEIESEEGEGDIQSLDCKSSFIELGLFSLIFLLL